MLINKDLGYVGGAEIQQVELAKELNKRGYKISFITYGDSHNSIEKINGIEIISAYDRIKSDNLSFIKKALLICKKMKEVDADIYFHRAGAPGITSIFGVICQKRVIDLIASYADVTGEVIIKQGVIEEFLEKIGNWFDIRLSDAVVSQNNFQKLKIKDMFNVESIIIKNAFNISPQRNFDCNADHLLWVGTIRSVKQPFLLLELAKNFPKYNFLMIGGEGEDPELFKKIKKSADNISNLNFRGFVSRNKISEYYKRSILLINTSKTEGFPNVFLEAWIHSIPIVSLNVDLDGLISRYKLGYCSKSYDQMIDDIDSLLKNKKLRQTMGENGRKYVEKNHNIKEIADQYENLIKSFPPRGLNTP